MFLKLNHKNLNVYEKIRNLNKVIYQVSKKLPADERFNTVQQIRRAALSVKLNFAEGSSRNSELERSRYYRVSRGSLVELDAALENACDLEFIKSEELKDAGEALNVCFAMITKMMDDLSRNNKK